MYEMVMFAPPPGDFKAREMRLSIIDMARLAAFLREVGVADRTTPPPPPWPTFDPLLPCWIREEPDGTTLAISPAEWYLEWLIAPGTAGLYGPPPEDVATLFRAHQQQLDEVRAWRPRVDDHRIPAHKLNSGDGWRVTPDECMHAVRGLRAAHNADRDAFAATMARVGFGENAGRSLVYRWIGFASLAADHGGFRVW